MAWITVTEWIIPPEAERIARTFEKQADKVNDLAAQLTRVKDELDYTWQGNSKNRFMGSFSSTPSMLNSYAAELRAQASVIRSIRVSVSHREWQADPEPDPSYDSISGY